MLKYSKVLAAAAIAASLGIGMTAKAATVTYTLVIGQNNGSTTGVAGQWSLFADDSSGDNFGIVAMGVGINKVLTINNDMPRATYLDASGTISDTTTAGFAASRANSPSLYPAGVPLTGSMDTTYANGTNIWLVQGFGQTGGTLPAFNVPNPGYDTRAPVTQPTYAAHLLIAHGTYDTTTGVLPTIDSSVTQTAANVLLALPPLTNPTTATLSTGPATIAPIVTINTIGGPATPEPASLGILAIGGIALLARRRKTA